jgi:hypothetical protein
VADHPRAPEAEVVEERDRVRRVPVDGVRRALVGRGRPALRIPDRGEEAVERLGALAEIVGHRRAAVEEERRRAASAAVAAEDDAVHGGLEGLDLHGT